MNNLRRLAAAILALMMLFTLTATAFADDKTSEAPVSQAPYEELAYLNGQLRVGMECAYAPNNWQEAKASDTNVPIENVPGSFAEGYDVQWARIIADYLGLELVIVKMDWDGLIPALNEGQIDAIIAGMMDTKERREAINFTTPYHATEYGMMVNAGSPFEGAKSIQDFAGASVLGQKDTALDTVIDQINGVEHLNPVSSIPDMVARLQQGACDAIVVNVENAPAYMAANPDFRLITFAEGDGFELPAKGSCVGLRYSDDVLLGLVNEALAGVDQAQRDVMWSTASEKAPA